MSTRHRAKKPRLDTVLDLAGVPKALRELGRQLSRFTDAKQAADHLQKFYDRKLAPLREGVSFTKDTSAEQVATARAPILGKYNPTGDSAVHFIAIQFKT